MMRNIHSRPPAEYMNFNALDGMDELLKERGLITSRFMRISPVLFLMR